jgi:hypothetical protein
MTLIKIILSMPRMISNAESVKNAIQVLGSLNKSRALSVIFSFKKSY